MGYDDVIDGGVGLNWFNIDNQEGNTYLKGLIITAFID